MQAKNVDEVFPNLTRLIDLQYELHSTAALAECEVIFLATPHAVAMKMVPALIEDGKIIIDLSADFRIQDVAVWEENYAVQHASPELIGQAVYGLPEINRDKIAGAQLIANPGCYPTAISLALLPGLRAGLLSPQSLIADAKSGVSGAGRKADINTSYVELNDNFKAYGLTGHRHHAEITQVLDSQSPSPVRLTFIPHLLPVNRGILATVYADTDQADQLHQVYHQAYDDEPYVEVLAAGDAPQLRSVIGTNRCLISIHPDANTERVVLVSVIDNLVKGAAGQAIQNMNIRLGYVETLGLTCAGFYP